MTFLLPVLVATLAAASPLGQLVTKQALGSVPAGWDFQSAAHAEHKLDLHIRLKEENMEQLQQRALEISDPSHRDYGRHLTKAEVDALTAPTQETVDSVTQWLASHGIEAGNVNSGYLAVTLSVEQAKALLNADYGVYTEAATGRQTVRTTSYSLPLSLLDSIHMIQPTTIFSDFGRSRRSAIQASRNTVRAYGDAPAICSKERATSDCLRANYNITGYAPTAGNTTFGITGFLEEVADMDDLSLYLKRYNPQIPSDTKTKFVSINNGSTTAHTRGEANLDTQIGVPLTYPIENIFYSVGGRPPFVPVDGNTENDNEPYLDFLKYTMALENPSQTYSISYGEDERSVPDDYKDAVCSQFLKLGARGVSVLVAAGDDGAGDERVCPNDDSTIDKFLPEFPTGCPWITSVGGTQGYADDEAADRSGGSGFSNHFARPDYQKDAVEAYVKSLNGKFDGKYNNSGRAYPDLAALYTSYPIYVHGRLGYHGGTSASTPVVSSIIALLNDYLVSNGRSPLGFLNPFLYKKGYEALRDITKGHVNACYDVSAFPAGKGWDSATGWGVPDFGRLKELL